MFSARPEKQLFIGGPCWKTFERALSIYEVRFIRIAVHLNNKKSLDNNFKAQIPFRCAC
jgi:hypothetical protein